MGDTRTRAAKNRAIRQEELRAKLSAGGHLKDVVDIAQKIQKGAATIESKELQALKASADIKLKIVNKYLPDLKSTELTGEGGGDLTVELVRFADSVTK